MTRTTATPIGPLNLTRTAAALAALDRADDAVDASDIRSDEVLDLALKRCDEARVALGDAFALDTADRNDPVQAATWARHRPEDMRRLVLAFPPPVR